MGTHCAIGIRRRNGTILAVYCHYEGHPELTGKILLRAYNTEERILELLAYGGMSFLHENIGIKQDFDLNLPQCRFYKRDRDEDGEELREFESDYIFIRHWDVDYVYLFEINDKHWYIQDNRSWMPLEPIVKERLFRRELEWKRQQQQYQYQQQQQHNPQDSIGQEC